ncbi:hypothetical protein [Catenulispora subtropica]
MRRAILKAGITVAVAASAATLVAPAAQASSYKQYITTYWYGDTWSECNNQGSADVQNSNAISYECDEVERVIHVGQWQQGYELWEYIRIG